jgi:hypothetical protein
MSREESINAISPRGFGIRARFSWLGDRYQHRIEAVAPGKVEPLLESIEGARDSPWPESPPIRLINLCTIQSEVNCGRVAMLSGSEGTNTWSICVTIRDLADESDDTLGVDWGLVFDVACQLSQRPKWLGCTYQALTAPIAISSKRQQAIVPSKGGGCLLQARNALLEMNTDIGPLPQLTFRVEPESITLPAAVRWSYGVRYQR